MSIAAQLQAIRSVLRGTSEVQIRPSVLFDSRAASDIDLKTIFPIALSGLEVLIELDTRFRSYKDSLFSQTSLELNREKMVPKEEEKVNRSICSYLRLLSGYLQLHAALKTLEYLIRRYLVHIYNLDELILCALPFHDTETFVRIVQLLDLGNSKWIFLEGVKASGAPPPRQVVVQQCVRDKGLLETLCNYASPTKEFQHSRPVICFCTAVAVEALGAIPKLDTDTVQRVLGFVFNGLNPAMSGNRDHKAAALMVVGLLATRATLSSKLIQSLIFFIARMAQHDANQSVDLPWLRVIIMALVTLVQSQSKQMLPKKTVLILREISRSEDSLLDTLLVMIEALPSKDLVEIIVSKVLASCMKLSQRMDTSDPHEAGNWGKKILNVLNKHYPCELRGAIRKFLENSRMNLKDEENIVQRFCLMFDGALDMPSEISDSKLWFSLEHPKAVVRQATLSNIAASGILKTIAADPKKLVNVQDAIVRALHDEDLSVVRAALSIDGLARIASLPCLLKAYDHVLSRCTSIFNKNISQTSLACDIAVSCLERMVLEFQSQHLDYSIEVAKMIFPLLLVLPKTWRVNLKALELVDKVKWPFYAEISTAHNSVKFDQMKNSHFDHAASINSRTIKALAETFVANPQENIQWLIECSSYNKLSKTLFFFIIFQALIIINAEFGSPLKIYQACFLAFKNQWREMELQGCLVPAEEFNVDKFGKSCLELVKHLSSADVEALNCNLLICVFWTILKSYNEAAKHNKLEDFAENFNILDELYLFFTTSPSRKLFRSHIQFLVMNCCRSPFEFLSKYFTEEGFSVDVQVQSLDLCGTICSLCALPERRNLEEDNYLQLLLGFPSLLVPLTNCDKDIRSSAIHCIQEFYNLWCTFDVSRLKNGNDMILPQFSSSTFRDFLAFIVNEKTLISSDVDFLPSYLTSMLGSSSNNLLAPDNSQNRFDSPAKDGILLFILHSGLKCSLYGKLKILSLLSGMGTLLLNVEGVKSLLIELVERRNQCNGELDKMHQKLSKNEIQVLCLLLEICFPLSSSACLDEEIVECVLRALRVDGFSTNEPAVLEPCVTVLRKLTPVFFDNLKTKLQDELFGNLVILFRNDNGDVRNATREALLRLNINCSTIVRFLELILVQGHEVGSSKRIKRRKHPSHNAFALRQDILCTEESRLSVLMALLDMMLQKKDIKERPFLVKPLFVLLEKIFSDDWLIDLANHGEKEIVSSPEVAESVTSAVYHAQQTTLLILKDISDSLLSNLPLSDNVFSDVKMGLLVEIVRSTDDVTTRNHVFLLLSSITKVYSGWISEHIIDIFAVIGESALKQIFIRALPEVAEPRRLTLMVYLLRILGEESSLGILIFHLFRSLILRITEAPEILRDLNNLFSSVTFTEWEYTFAVQICNQYTCKIWFPCLVKLVQLLRENSGEEEFLLELYLVMQFTVHKLQDTKLVFELESGRDVGYLQMGLRALLQQVVLHLQLIRSRRKLHGITMDIIKQLKSSANAILNVITSWMVPSTYFEGISQLLEHTDKNVKKQTLGLLCETVKNHGLIQKKQKDKKAKLSFPLVIDDNAKPAFTDLCLKIVQLVDGRTDTSDTRVKLAAISSLEALSKEFPSDSSIFATCITTIVKHICSDDLAISSGCIRATGTLITVLGSKALPQLPLIMKNMIEKTHEISICPMIKLKHIHSDISDGISGNKLSILLSVLTTLEVVIDKLGGFLNPYLKDILDLIVLHPEYALDLDLKTKMKADSVRKLLVVTIPVRLMLTPLRQIYSSALECGESSLSLVFEMLASMISSMDRPAIGTYHVKIFKHCLVALDLRRQLPESIKNINMVERSVIDAMTVLTMKLTETMFRPLFFHSLEWAESEFEGGDCVQSRSLDRSISFYNMVSKLTEHHRSLFVPYFKHLLEGCIRYLTEAHDVNEALAKRRKKAKVADSVSRSKYELLSLKQWHLRAVILKSLYKCFLYDNDLKLLDSTNFQVLLKPIVSQLVIEPPKSLEQTQEVPSVEEVDESLVLCLGQMAITARSDILWKPLNHEVLMQTRNEKIRPKILGLKIVKYLVEHLKEEYLVFLPETIPFLGELLEDAELPVKTLAQEILREMEHLSGESLRQYL
ncbi:U3 small nucleolar RNA-associated protein 10 [Musa troglodytarum]|uniref:U3 small nucleolar RNA-associated protein 10 n=1 Tax=Musa troglodytarum TaxID=320322 RepID=A0A9E7ELI0_9LILI|nr:U3 small nucleolar RNA-associated protein 10 [Musa troglodytarum]